MSERRGRGGEGSRRFRDPDSVSTTREATSTRMRRVSHSRTNPKKGNRRSSSRVARRARSFAHPTRRTPHIARRRSRSLPPLVTDTLGENCTPPGRSPPPTSRRLRRVYASPMNANTANCPTTPGRFVGSGRRREYINSFLCSGLTPSSHSRNAPTSRTRTHAPRSIAPGNPPLAYRTSRNSAWDSSYAARSACESVTSRTPTLRARARRSDRRP